MLRTNFVLTLDHLIPFRLVAVWKGSHGLKALSQKWLEEQGCLTAYKRVYALGCSMEHVATSLNVLDDTSVCT